MTLKSFDEMDASHKLAYKMGKVDAARRVANVQTLVDEQAENEALWFIDVSISEGYLQQELRRLHAAIENITTENTDGD